MPDTVPEGQLRPPVSIAERAVAMIQDLLQGTLDGADDELAELAGRLHPRAVKKVAEFVEIVKNNGAQVAIGLNGREVALRNPDEVNQAMRRLSTRNIVEATTTMTGILIGMIPSRSSFEFRERNTDEPIQGKGRTRARIPLQDGSNLHQQGGDNKDTPGPSGPEPTQIHPAANSRTGGIPTSVFKRRQPRSNDTNLLPKGSSGSDYPLPDRSRQTGHHRRPAPPGTTNTGGCPRTGRKLMQGGVDFKIKAPTADNRVWTSPKVDPNLILTSPNRA